MKNIKILSAVMLSTFILFMTQGIATAGKQYGKTDSGDSGNPLSNILIMPSQPLDDNERAAILKMREEEKLARDVYLTLRDKWGLVVFHDIAQSEQNHMDMVKELIEKYGLTDPVADDTVGAFTQAGFSDLYNALVASGSESVTSALKVGAKIEDLDIHDLNIEIERSDNYDIQNVFSNLRRGSYNHMQSFVSGLEAYGETYVPEYISQDEFETIMNFTKGNGSGYKTSYYTMLPGTMVNISGDAKNSFTLTPSIFVPAQYIGSSATLYSLIYWVEMDQWYVMTQPGTLAEWTPGTAIPSFGTMTLSGDSAVLNLFPNPMDLSQLVGTFYVYYGYQPTNGNLIYTFQRVTFQ